MSDQTSALRRETVNFLWIAGLSMAGGGALVAIRFALTDRFFYSFLLWNLFLALIPYGVSVAVFAVAQAPRGRGRTAWLSVLGLLWLAFYPNAPYIFTDFIHLANKTFVRSGTELLAKDTLLWFDLMLCSAFAYLGHTAGLISIDLVLRACKGVLPPMAARVLVGFAIALAGFGMYVGRFVRFNSWDLFLHPLDTVGRIVPYLVDPKAILLSAAFAFFILITYTVHHLSRRRA